ncbi:MAG: hypothetical protein AAGD10_14365 [Myxococcota bacterium]
MPGRTRSTVLSVALASVAACAEAPTGGVASSGESKPDGGDGMVNDAGASSSLDLGFSSQDMSAPEDAGRSTDDSFVIFDDALRNGAQIVTQDAEATVFAENALGERALRLLLSSSRTAQVSLDLPGPTDLSPYSALVFSLRAPSGAPRVVVSLRESEDTPLTEFTEIELRTPIELAEEWKEVVVPVFAPSRFDRGQRALSIRPYGLPDEPGILFLDEVRFVQQASLPEAFGRLGVPTSLMLGRTQSFCCIDVGPRSRFDSGPQYWVSAGALEGFGFSAPGILWIDEKFEVEPLAPGEITVFGLSDELQVYPRMVQVRGRVTRPDTGPSGPTFATDEVLALFSEAYVEAPFSFIEPPRDTGRFDEITLAENQVLVYRPFREFGRASRLYLDDASLDLTDFSRLRFDLWLTNITELRVDLVDAGADDTLDTDDDFVGHFSLTQPVEPFPRHDRWVEIDIPMSAFGFVRPPTNIQALRVSANEIEPAYLDNILLVR